MEKCAITALMETGWSEQNSKLLAELIEGHAKSRDCLSSERAYCVFDFDNTTCVGDSEDLFLVEQLKNLYFAIRPESMGAVLMQGMSDVAEHSYFIPRVGKSARPADMAADASAAYKRLWDCGLISSNPVNSYQKTAYEKNPDFLEFSSKMRCLYDLVAIAKGDGFSYLWCKSWFTGMKPEELRKAAELYLSGCLLKDGDKLHAAAFSGPNGYDSRCGPVRTEFSYPYSISKGMRALYRLLKERCIDIYIVSTSHTEIIDAQAYMTELFGLEGVAGIYGISFPVEEGRYVCRYSESLIREMLPERKTRVIRERIAPGYHGRGPLLTAMDSAFDLDFCTAFPDTQLTLIMSRARGNAATEHTGLTWPQCNWVETFSTRNRRYAFQGIDETNGQLVPVETTAYPTDTDNKI